MGVCIVLFLSCFLCVVRLEHTGGEKPLPLQRGLGTRLVCGERNDLGMRLSHYP